jgi:two-component system, NarL family, response regulator LiaR
MMDKIRLLIVDDHELVRQGLRGFLELQDDFAIVGEGTTGLDAVEMAADLKPDIVLLDLIMPEMDGVEATRRILSADPDTRIVILSSFSDEDNVFPAIQAGAMGYMLKDISPDDLADTLRETHKGKTQIHPDIARKLMQKVQQPDPPNGGSSPADELTARETDVLKCIGRGLSNKEIADELSISHMTVKTHVSNLLGKLGLYDRTQAAIFAIKEGIVESDTH